MNAFLYLILTTASLFFSHLPLVAQSDTAYKPFPTKDAMWVYMHSNKGDPEVFPKQYSGIYKYCFLKDTSVRGKIYQGIGVSSKEDVFDSFSGEKIETLYNYAKKVDFFLREENRRIYRYDPQKAEEYLLYNFAVKKNDTFRTKMDIFGEGLFSLDTIMIDAHEKKVYVWALLPDKVTRAYVAEGIGLLWGLPFQPIINVTCICILPSLVGFVSGNDFADTLCHTFTERDSKLSSKQLPTDFILRNDKLYLTNADSKDFPIQLTLLNPLGLSVLESTIDSENTVISLPSLPEGIYFAKVYSLANQKSCTRKILFTFN